MKRQLNSNRPHESLSVIFGTHNRESVDTVIAQLESNDLATKAPSGKLKLRDDVQGKVGIAQLYGQSHLTYHVPNLDGTHLDGADM